MHRCYGKQLVDCIEVNWDASSEDSHVKNLGEARHKAKEIRSGHQLPRPVMLDKVYEKTSSMMVEHMRFIKVN